LALRVSILSLLAPLRWLGGFAASNSGWALVGWESGLACLTDPTTPFSPSRGVSRHINVAMKLPH